MLKKLNANITRLLFYIKNNLVSCVFKFSILSTMLILVYLVLMLSQTDNVSSRENSGVYPIESSQKLMLTIPTEVPIESLSDFDGLYSTTEYLEAITDNSISKSDNMYIGTHPLFPIQEPMTTPMTIIDEIKIENEIISEEEIANITLLEPVMEEELSIPTSTQEIIAEDVNHKMNNDHETTSTESIVISIQSSSTQQYAPPIKRSLFLDVPQKLISTAIDTTTEPQMAITATESLAESTEKDQITTNSPLSTSTPDSTIALVLSTPSPISDDSLFLENWSHDMPAENEDYNIDSKNENLDFIREPAKSLFQNEVSELAPTELSLLKNELSDSSSLLEQNKEVNSDIENTSHISYSDTEDTQPMFSPRNLLNLFTFDHQPSSSNLKQTTWWPKSKSSSLSFLAENAAKNQKHRANRILRNDASQDNIRNQHVFNNLFNRKLQSSVNILEKLFGNYFLQ